MPQPERSYRRQDAVLWEASGNVDSYGVPLLEAPVDIKVRWNKVRAQARDQAGNPTNIDATVVVDRVVPVGSRMWLGTHEDFLGTGSSGGTTEVMEVVRYEETPDVKARASRKMVYLARYKDAQGDLG